MVNGALVALGTLAVVDNVVFHWWLGWHRLNEGWSHEVNLVAEILVVVVGVGMVVGGLWRARRSRPG